MSSKSTLSLAILAALRATAEPFEGMATHFLGIGYPYGACGVSDEVAALEAAMDTASGQADATDYVALNVYDTPGDYQSPGTLGRRPLTGADTALMGMYRNGLNCGRWIKLTLGDTCDGVNDGAMNQPFCRGGTGWHPNAYTGSGLHAIVFDQCTDGNAWCRDSKYHVDLHTSILSHLRKDGQILPPLAKLVLDADGNPKADPNNPYAREYVVAGFENPKISWEFAKAPNYQGEPRFWFSLDAKLYYMRMMVTHLPNGIHGVEQWTGGAWKKATMDGEAGQLWNLPDPSTKTIKLRLIDADDQLVMAGRTWTMDYPAACGTSCSKPATAAENLVGEGGDAGGTDLAPRNVRAERTVRVGGRLLFAGAPRGGTIELGSPDGTMRRLTVSQGVVELPRLPAGLWFARWTTAAGKRESMAIPVP
jgi:hypothetical protein